MKQKIHNTYMFRNQGFTIIETLVALAIFTTSILSIIVLTPGGVQAINLSKNKLTASHLAEEGIDLVRILRDNGKISGTDELPSLESSCATANGGCIIDPDTLTVTPFSICTNQPNGCGLSTNPSFGGFGYSQTNPLTVFTRTIFVDQNSPGDDFDVTSSVEWNQGGNSRQVEFKTNLTYWN